MKKTELTNAERRLMVVLIVPAFLWRFFLFLFASAAAIMGGAVIASFFVDYNNDLLGSLLKNPFEEGAGDYKQLLFRGNGVAGFSGLVLFGSFVYVRWRVICEESSRIFKYLKGAGELSIKWARLIAKKWTRWFFKGETDARRSRSAHVADVQNGVVDAKGHELSKIVGWVFLSTGTMMFALLSFIKAGEVRGLSFAPFSEVLVALDFEAEKLERHLIRLNFPDIHLDNEELEEAKFLDESEIKHAKSVFLKIVENSRLLKEAIHSIHQDRSKSESEKVAKDAVEKNIDLTVFEIKLQNLRDDRALSGTNQRNEKDDAVGVIDAIANAWSRFSEGLNIFHSLGGDATREWLKGEGNESIRNFEETVNSIWIGIEKLGIANLEARSISAELRKTVSEPSKRPTDPLLRLEGIRNTLAQMNRQLSLTAGNESEKELRKIKEIIIPSYITFLLPPIEDGKMTPYPVPEPGAEMPQRFTFHFIHDENAQRKEGKLTKGVDLSASDRKRVKLICDSLKLHSQPGNPVKVFIVGFASAEPVKLNGQVVKDSDEQNRIIARTRAEKVAEAVKQYGKGDPGILIEWEKWDADPKTGQSGFDRMRDARNKFFNSNGIVVHGGDVDDDVKKWAEALDRRVEIRVLSLGTAEPNKTFKKFTPSSFAVSLESESVE